MNIFFMIFYNTQYDYMLLQDTINYILFIKLYIMKFAFIISFVPQLLR